MKTVYGPYADVEVKASVHAHATDKGARVPLALTGCSRAMAKANELNAREDGTAPDWMGWRAEYHPGCVRAAEGEPGHESCARCGVTPAEGWFAVLRLGPDGTIGGRTSDAAADAPWLCACSKPKKAAVAPDDPIGEYERQAAVVARLGQPCGLNADWNCQAYRIGTVGAWGVFLVDEEDGCWALVARRIVDDAADDREIARWGTRAFTEILGTFPENAVGRLLAMAKAAVAA